MARTFVYVYYNTYLNDIYNITMQPNSGGKLQPNTKSIIIIYSIIYYINTTFL